MNDALEGAPLVAEAPPADPGRTAPLTMRDELARVGGGVAWSSLYEWPPDLFAFTGVVLADSGVYRHVVCPPPGRRWPPLDELAEGLTWDDAVRGWAAEWAAWALSGAHAGPSGTPVALLRFGGRVEDALDVPLVRLADDEHWNVVVALLALHAMADEVCARTRPASMARAWDAPNARPEELERPFFDHAARTLTEVGSISRLPTDRIAVLPKLRPPEAGITLRSLSHHLALDRSEVEVSWFFAPRPTVERDTAKLTLLLVPYPETVHASDFRPVQGPLLNMDPERYGFFEFSPQEPFDIDAVVSLVESARRYAGPVDAVVLPEAALEGPTAHELQARLASAGVPYLIAGVREHADSSTFGGNHAHFGGLDWCAPPQHKHHRWIVDPRQVQQYHLGAALDPRLNWWESISIQRRKLTFVTVSDWLTVCPLVCEDLARPDPVADVVRAVGPTLVVALLLDGPQLASRWPARYASVLADDPGCAVLTLTSLGMVQRSLPPGARASRVIALWKDPRSGLQEIALAEGAHAVALTAHARRVELFTADGRSNRDASQLVLSGIEQVG